MKHVLISRTDGGVSILSARDETNLEAEVGKWRTSCPGLYVSHREIAVASIPADRTFRDAWVSLGGRVQVDMPKAREIHRGRLRVMRKPKLDALDAEYMKALEAGDTARQASVAATKQALRDVTADPAIEAARTPDALKEVIPAALK